MKTKFNILSSSSTIPPHNPVPSISLTPHLPSLLPSLQRTPSSFPTKAALFNTQIKSLPSFASPLNHPFSSEKSSFTTLKVFYCDTGNKNKKIVPVVRKVEEPVIFHLESFGPRSRMIQKDSPILRNRKCTCSKTKCLKKYCECLANNQYCYNCSCVDCHNLPSFQQEKLKGNGESITCTCSKSNCNKKYCECFKYGKKCNDNCRCLNCKNQTDTNMFTVEANKEEEKSETKKEEFVIQKISVFIDKGIISVDEKILGKKRENDNVLFGIS